MRLIGATAFVRVPGVHTLGDTNEDDVGDITVYKLKTLYSYRLLAPTSFIYCLCAVSATNLDCHMVHVPYVRYHNTVTSVNPGENCPALRNCP